MVRGTSLVAIARVISVSVAINIGSTGTLAGAERAGSQVKPVGVLNSETWQTARGVLPEEFLNRYRTGEWSHEIYEAPPGTHFYDEDFVAAGTQNEGRYAIGTAGQVIEVATGKQPAFIYGPPFPILDTHDPQAGGKAVWNFFYQSYLLGNSRNFMNLMWVGTNGPERMLGTEVHQRFFDGQPRRYRPEKNPQNFLFQQMSGVTQPADLQGTVSLTHRFRDPTRRDQVWSFVPALRRVRAVSPANRSDGFLGSDMSQDDGSYFDGKPEDFTWRLVGDGEMLVLYDRTALLGQQHDVRPLPGGGFEARYALRPRFAYEIADWSGLAWRPLPSEFVLVKRPVWIVEGVPKDQYYLYGKIMLRFDKESWGGTYNSKYGWKGEILNSYLPMFGPLFQIDGEWRYYAAALFTMSQNWKGNRATVGLPSPDNPVARTRLAYPDSFFTVDQLTRRGK